MKFFPPIPGAKTPQIVGLQHYEDGRTVTLTWHPVTYRLELAMREDEHLLHLRPVKTPMEAADYLHTYEWPDTLPVHPLREMTELDTPSIRRMTWEERQLWKHQ